MAEAIAGATGCSDPAGSLLTVINEVTEVKARAMAAAGYSADTGGMLPSLRPQLLAAAAEPAR